MDVRVYVQFVDCWLPPKNTVSLFLVASKTYVSLLQC